MLAIKISDDEISECTDCHHHYIHLGWFDVQLIIGKILINLQTDRSRLDFRAS